VNIIRSSGGLIVLYFVEMIVVFSFPNLITAQVIFVTMPVSVASLEKLDLMIIIKIQLSETLLIQKPESKLSDLLSLLHADNTNHWPYARSVGANSRWGTVGWPYSCTRWGKLLLANYKLGQHVTYHRWVI